jgi:hypothetical protein
VIGGIIKRGVVIVAMMICIACGKEPQLEDGLLDTSPVELTEVPNVKLIRFAVSTPNCSGCTKKI